MTVSQADKAKKLRALHEAPGAFVIPNPWDAGSARVLEALGFQALATSSGAKAGVLGKRDGRVTREEALANARLIAGAVDIPVIGDLEKGFGDTPDAAALTIRGAADAGLVGGSIEDATGNKDAPLFDLKVAAERVAAASKAAKALPFPFVLTARAENHIRGHDDLDDTVQRLQAYADAGADVVYAPGLRTVDAIATVCRAVDRPVNVLARSHLTVADVVGAGAQRVSVGGSLTWVAVRALTQAATAIRDRGDLSMLDARAPSW